MPGFRLVSHHLCPYVQRVAIVLREKGVAFERIWIDLANKPEWFLKLSPLDKVPRSPRWLRPAIGCDSKPFSLRGTVTFPVS